MTYCCIHSTQMKQHFVKTKQSNRHDQQCDNFYKYPCYQSSHNIISLDWYSDFLSLYQAILSYQFSFNFITTNLLLHSFSKQLPKSCLWTFFSLTERAQAATLLNCWKLYSQSVTNESFNYRFQLFGSWKKIFENVKLELILTFDFWINPQM